MPAFVPGSAIIRAGTFHEKIGRNSSSQVPGVPDIKVAALYVECIDVAMRLGCSLLLSPSLIRPLVTCPPWLFEIVK